MQRKDALLNKMVKVFFRSFQEAKSSCAGQWYLPAGRMEPGEDIAEAAKREVLEETGLNFDLSTLLAVETAGKFSKLIKFKSRLTSSFFEGGSWYRFVVTGNVTGGKLKTPADADSESLQAKWVGDLGELSLRATDVIPIIERGRSYSMRRPDEPWHLPQVIRFTNFQE